MEAELKMVKAAAKSAGLSLIGDRVIGYRFVPRCDEATFADRLLGLACDDSGHLAAWCEANKELDYAHADWNCER